MNKWTRLFEGSHASAAPAGPSRAPAPHHYFAFLSYSHSDSADADWLHNELERFRVSSSLAGKLTANGVIPKRLTPIFRDRHELAASHDLGCEIRQALELSRALIVLCSPAAAKSKWVNAEIDQFKRIHPEGCIIAAVVAGEPLASDIPGREDEECFPPALIAKYNRRGKPTGQKTEPLAADLREGKGGRRTGFLKIVAGILGVGLDDLVQREHLRRQRRMAYIAAASLAGMGVTSTLAVTAFQARDEAREQRRQAEGLVGFMLGDLKDKLQPIGRLDTLDAVGSRALAYYEKQDKSELSDGALAQRASALTLIGEIAQTRGDLQAALARYQEAFASTAEAVRRDPDNPQRLFEHAQNVFWVGAIAYRQGRLVQAERAWREYKRLADRMVELARDNKDYKLEQVYANSNLGTVLMDRRQYSSAASAFQSLLALAEGLAAAEPANLQYQKQVSDTLAWLADANEFTGSLDRALAERERQLELLSALQRLTPRDSALVRDAMTAHRSIGRLLASRGETAAGVKEMQTGVNLSDSLFQIEPENTEWLQANVSGRFDLAELQLAIGDAEAAAATTRAGCDIVDRLRRKSAAVADWRSAHSAWCLDLRARLALIGGSNAEALELAKESLQAARNSPERVDRALWSIRALSTAGDALAASGRHSEALRLWKSALSMIPAGIELRPSDLAKFAGIEARVGNHAAERRITARLAAIGYRYPKRRS